MHRLLASAVAALLLLLTAVGSALAYRVQPLIVTLRPSGPEASTKVSIQNTEAGPITLELTPLRVTVDENGEAVRTDELSDIMVFPPQAIIPPGREQVVQLRYVGEPEIDTARVYAIRVSQLPVDMGQGEATGGARTEIKVGVDFLVHALVQTEEMDTAVDVAATRTLGDGSIEFDLENDGDAVAVIADVPLFASDANGTRIALDPASFQTRGFGALFKDGPPRTVAVGAEHLTELSGDVAVTVDKP